MITSGYLYYFSLCFCVVIFCGAWLKWRLPELSEQRSNKGAMVYAVLAATNGSFVVTLAKMCALLVKDTFKVWCVLYSCQSVSVHKGTCFLR